MFPTKNIIADKKLLLALATLFILSAIDGGLTLWGLGLKTIKEVNPLMQLLVTKSSGGFMAVKLALPVVVGVIFWQIKNRSRRFVNYSLGLILIVYTIVLMFHVLWILEIAA
jgi:hypothetical protein